MSQLVCCARAKIGMPEAALGVIPGFGGTQRLPRLVGVGKALELLATGDQLTAEEALRIGLVNHVTGPEQLMERCEAMAIKISANSKYAISIGKQSIRKCYETDINRGMSYEADFFGLIFTHRDQKEGMSAFLENRKPNFSN